ncbi:MAG TPA: hypothetical protein V6D20_17715 [Candidatus Obscuribacterales bacterium]
MTTTVYRGDDAIPIEVSWEYQLGPAGTQWVEITDIVGNKVYVRGLGNTIAAWSTTIKRFDDLVGDYNIKGYFLITEDSLFNIGTEDGLSILGS